MIWAIFGALCIGLSLGLLGSGGSILTVPVLHEALGHVDQQAIAESLGIVGCIALAGAIPNIMQRQVHWRSVVFFGMPGMLGAWLGSLAGHHVGGTVRLAVFATVMLAAAVLMLRGPTFPDQPRQRRNLPLLAVVAEGIFVGLVTGFVGVGGGFMIVPALIFLGGLPMRLAVGTSLLIISINAFTGFASQVPQLHSQGLHVDWHTFAIFVVVGVLASLAGNVIGGKINQRTLRRFFGCVLIVTGSWILLREGRKLVASHHDRGTVESATFHEPSHQSPQVSFAPTGCPPRGHDGPHASAA